MNNKEIELIDKMFNKLNRLCENQKLIIEVTEEAIEILSKIYKLKK